MAFYRWPSPLELTYIAQDTPTASPVVNQYIVEGEGSLDLRRLRAAVEATARVIPETRMRLRGVWRFRHWDDAGALPRVIEADGGHWDGISGDGAPWLGQPLDVRTGPVCEVILLHGMPLRLLFRTHHACMDGAGTLFFIQQVFRHLRAEPPTGPSSALTEWDVARAHPTVPRRVALGGCTAPVRNPALSGRETGCHWRRLIHPGTPAGLSGKLLSVLSSVADEAGSPRTIARVTADLRRYLDADQFTVSNCSAALDIDISGEQDPRRLQQAVIGAMRQQQDLASIVPKAHWLRWFPLSRLRCTSDVRAAQHARNAYNYTFTLTNLGRMDPAVMSAPGFLCTGMFGVPIPLELTPVYVAFIQYGGVTALHVQIPAALGTAEDLEALCRVIVHRLQALETGKYPASTPAHTARQPATVAAA